MYWSTNGADETGFLQAFSKKIPWFLPKAAKILIQNKFSRKKERLWFYAKKLLMIKLNINVEVILKMKQQILQSIGTYEKVMYSVQNYGRWKIIRGYELARYFCFH